MELHNKVAIVTGGATGIGLATSLALARAGCAVAINYSRSEADALAAVAQIQAMGGRALAVQANVARDAEVRAMAALVASEWGGIDYLVNNAGTTVFIPLSDLESVTDEVWDTILAVNVKGAFYCARAVAPYMRARGAGAIVNVTSVAGIGGDGSCLPYATSKAAGIGLTKSLARALAPTIRVCSVAPGMIDTRWNDGRKERVHAAAATTLLGRNATPDDCAAAILMLLAQDGMTGQTIVVDGGRLLVP